MNHNRSTSLERLNGFRVASIIVGAAFEKYASEYIFICFRNNLLVCGEATARIV